MSRSAEPRAASPLPPPRRLQTLKRAGLRVAIALLVLQVTACVFYVWVDFGPFSVGLGRGCVFLVQHVQPIEEGLAGGLLVSRPRMLPNAFPTLTRTGTYWRGWLPIWIPLVVIMAGTVIFWLVDRRPYGAGRCQHCGYDLTGNMTGRCSECGAAVE